ncbi:hypothetical protein J6590_038562 [Homalodisca vitripennis]|nr:hypothetical protein J6590_038562 [Homalodisca vitripennis]
MFGTKLRTWMETHIVRSRKKQHRNKEDKKSGNCSKIIGGSPPCHIQSNSFERQYGKKSPKHNEDKGVLEVQSTDISIPTKASMSLQNNTIHSTINNLSSPESAYSTGYSTDGTSPGASIPPEYYINIRTGTHYFHSNPGTTGPPLQNPVVGNTFTQAVDKNIACKVGSLIQPPSAVSITVLSPRPGRHKKEDGTKKKVRQNGEQLPESSTEEDIADKQVKVNLTSPQQMSTPKAKNKLIHPMYSSSHRRTESYDESQQSSSLQSQERDSGDSLSAVPSGGYQCSSPYLPGASPRQRNRIRTNPWLGANVSNNGSVPGSRSYNSQGETSSTVGSSSTLSSSGCKQTSDDNSHGCLSPRSKERRRLVKEHLKDVKNCNTSQNSSTAFSPVSKVKKRLNAVTTCSPQPNRSCHHSLRARSPASSSSPSSSPSSASEDEHHGNTSDFSDDDVTLNEMLGKFDESYVYEKETDILSDSDPTDCEDQGEYEDRTDYSNLPESEQHEDFDFIDNGSLVELARSDSECSNKAQLAGHCTYHHLPGYTPDMTRKLTPRLRESMMRRQAVNRNSRDRQSRRSSRNKTSEGRKKIDSPLLSHKRSSTYRKASSQSLDNKNSCEALPEANSPTHLHNRRSKRGDSVPRAGEAPGKYINLNRVLMERLINNQRNGTRSADGTPVSLRKRGSPATYNGKYMKNHYVSNLISSDANFNKRRSSLEDKHGQADLNDDKPRSNSVSVHCHQGINVVSSSPPSVAVGLHDLDKEGDLKYRQLIQEAEHIIEDLQVKTRTDYLSPTFRSKTGMERAKPSSPLVFSVPPSPLSLRYDVYRDGMDTPPRVMEHTNNNSIYEQPMYSLHKEKNNDQEEGLLKTISKTLERIIIRGTSDTNRKLDKSVSDPFAKGKKNFVFQPNGAMFANRGIPGNCVQEGGHYSGYATPNLLRRSSTGNTPSKLSTFNSASKLNQNEITNQSGFRKFFRRPDKYKTTSFDEHLDKHNFPENGFCLNSGFRKPTDESLNKNCDLYQHTAQAKQDIPVHNARYLEMRSPLMDYSPNGNTPTYLNGFQQIPWQHRTSQAERLKHLSDLQQSPKRKTDSPELPFEQKPTLVSFRSFDLGNKNAVGSGYCPQSEPVKRKIYTCSATFEKLQKTLLRKQPEIHPCKDTTKETG